MENNILTRLLLVLPLGCLELCVNTTEGLQKNHTPVFFTRIKHIESLKICEP